MTDTATALILSLNNVEVVYDHVSLAIKGVSLDVPAGGMVALSAQRRRQEHDLEIGQRLLAGAWRGGGAAR